MIRRPFLLLATAGLGLAACTTTGSGGAPADVIRYHLGAPLERGTVIVQPTSGTDLAAQSFAAAVARELAGVGYVQAPPNGAIQFIATVDVRRSAQEGPPRSSGLSIGLGGGGFSGGRHGGGVGLGGGLSFPIGGNRRNTVYGTELTVTIKRRVDQSPVWEGHARTIARRNEPEAATADRLARALFTGFPGESGRTITVR